MKMVVVAAPPPPPPPVINPQTPEEQAQSLIVGIQVNEALIEDHEELAEEASLYGEEPFAPDPNDPDGYISGNEEAAIQQGIADNYQEEIGNYEQQLMELGYP
jgi:hypothetical protein